MLLKRLLIFLLFTNIINVAASYDLLIINSQNGEPYTTVYNSMLETLSNDGYKVGENLHISSWSIANSDGLARRVWLTEKEIPYDVIFLNGTLAATNFKEFAYGDDRYKFVFGAVTDPVGIGLIDNFVDSPKANFTGICYPVSVENRLSFIKKLMPEAKTIGLIYADMPQSISYRDWIEEELKKEEFADLKFIFRSVEFIQSEAGHKRMSMLAEKYIHELDPLVDVFLSPNDQMGTQSPFARAVYSIATKPLIGVGRKDVIDHWGATMSIFPSLDNIGEVSAQMIIKIFEGQEIGNIKPRWPEEGIAFDLEKMEQFHITISDEILKLAEENIVP